MLLSIVVLLMFRCFLFFFCVCCKIWMSMQKTTQKCRKRIRSYQHLCDQQTFFELMWNFIVFLACYPVFWFYENEHDSGMFEHFYLLQYFMLSKEYIYDKKLNDNKSGLTTVVKSAVISNCNKYRQQLTCSRFMLTLLACKVNDYDYDIKTDVISDSHECYV